MSLPLESLLRKKDVIAQRWLERALEPYAEDARRFYLQENDPFRNPIGQTLRRGLPVLVDALLGEGDLREAAPALDAIIRIKAVQESSAAQAAAFILALETIVREEVDAGGASQANDDLLALLDGRIGELAQLAEEMFAACREQITQLKVNESKRRTYVGERIAARQRQRAIFGQCE